MNTVRKALCLIVGHDIFEDLSQKESVTFDGLGAPIVDRIETRTKLCRRCNKILSQRNYYHNWSSIMINAGKKDFVISDYSPQQP